MIYRKQRFPDCWEEHERRIINCSKAVISASRHGSTQFVFEGHSGVVVGEIWARLVPHGTGGYHNFLFIPDQNPGMVISVPAYVVKFEDE